MSNFIWLEPTPNINGSRLSFGEEEGKPLYKNPCLMLMGEEANKLVDSLDNKTKATPSRYYIKETEEVDAVRLFLSKCPDGTIQEVRQSRCVPRPGIDLKQLCDRVDPLTKKTPIQMLNTHIKKITQSQGGQTGAL